MSTKATSNLCRKQVSCASIVTLAFLKPNPEIFPIDSGLSATFFSSFTVTIRYSAAGVFISPYQMHTRAIFGPLLDHCGKYNPQFSKVISKGGRCRGVALYMPSSSPGVYSNLSPKPITDETVRNTIRTSRSRIKGRFPVPKRLKSGPSHGPHAAEFPKTWPICISRCV